MAAGRMKKRVALILDWLWQAELTDASPFKRKIWHGGRVAFAVVRDVLEGHITLHAMSLVYTTLLSLVPFLALSFSVLKGFGVHNQLEPLLEQFLITPLGPEKGQIAVQNILAFVDNIKVGVLGSVGLALLVYTVISLVQKIEYSFNEIWRIGHSRPLGQRFSNYLSVILIGPVLVFSALGATTAVVNTDLVRQITTLHGLEWIFTFVGRILPYLMIIGLFTFLYTFVPNTKVKLKYALIGGVVAGVIWQTTGFAFTIFASSSTRYEAIYSGFAVAIMLLIWLYLAWLILLLGAAVAFYAQHASQITRSRTTSPSAVIDEATGLAIVYQVAKKFDEDGGGSSLAEMESNLSVGPETIRRIVRRLTRHKLIMRAGSNGNLLVPARSLDKMSLKKLIDVLREPETPMPPSLRAYPRVNNVVGTMDRAFAEALGEKTVSEWIREE